MQQMRIVDHTLDAIADGLGRTAPEQGGALLGLPGANVVTSFVHDTRAAATDVQYRNSSWLIEQVNGVETATAARFKGIIHSHPGLCAPSAQDRREFAHSLSLNPHIGRYLAPIVTHDVETPPDGHELIHGPARLSCYGVVRAGGETGDGSPVAVQPMRPVVVPVMAALARAGFQRLSDPAVLPLDQVAMLAVRARHDHMDVSAVLFSSDFPAVPPILLTHDRSRPVTVNWDMAVPGVDRLAMATSRVRGRPARARRRRWRPTIGPGPGRILAPDIFFARSQGLLSPLLAGRHAVLAGAGSVGGYMAESLARAGVGALTLIDPEQVAAENLSRSGYAAADIGAAKVTALARRLRAINPRLAVTCHRQTVGGLPPALLASTIKSAQLVVAATDDNVAQRRIDQLSYWAGVPAVFLGMYRGAAGGEVIMTYPGSACWGCATAGVRDLSADTELDHPTDYGTGRLIAEPGLLADIHHVCAAGAKVALALLHSSEDPVAIARFLDDPRRQGRSYVAFGTQPGFWLFPHVMRETAGQHAFQSVWMSVDRDPECPVCGPPSGRTDPLAHPVPNLERARRLAAVRRRGRGPGRDLGREPGRERQRGRDRGPERPTRPKHGADGG